MPYASREARRARARDWYRKKAADPEFRAAQATRMRDKRAALTPDERAAVLAQKRAARMLRRSDPKVKATEREKANARYAEDVADPVAWEKRRSYSQKRYAKDQPWRMAQEANRRAARRNIPADLTREWVYRRWTGCCELTGLPFTLGRTSLGPYSPSIDRIDNSLGYTKDNCRFVLFALNAAKNTGTDKDLYAIAEALLSRRSR